MTCGLRIVEARKSGAGVERGGGVQETSIDRRVDGISMINQLTQDTRRYKIGRTFWKSRGVKVINGMPGVHCT